MSFVSYARKNMSTLDNSRWEMVDGEKVCQLLIEVLQQTLDFKAWGFRFAYSHIYPEHQHIPYAIFDSEKCRVMFALTAGGRYQRGPTMSVYYGRLHAPNVGEIIVWNGEECWCWHGWPGVNQALNFLDGLSPQDAVDQMRVKQQPWPDVPQQFMHTEAAKKLMWNGYLTPELWVNMQKVIWAHYGDRLFDLFDLRRPDLWEQYVLFVREYYRIIGRVERTRPKGIPSSEDKIC
jgi:hypothetical protein